MTAIAEVEHLYEGAPDDSPKDSILLGAAFHQESLSRYAEKIAARHPLEDDIDVPAFTLHIEHYNQVNPTTFLELLPEVVRAVAEVLYWLDMVVEADEEVTPIRDSLRNNRRLIVWLSDNLLHEDSPF